MSTSILPALQERFGGRMFVRVDEAAALLSIGINTIRNNLTAGTFPVPTVKIGGRRVIAISDLAEFLDRERGVESEYSVEWKRRGPQRKYAAGGAQ